MKAFKLLPNNTFAMPPVRATVNTGGRGATPAISSNGLKDAIVWEV